MEVFFGLKPLFFFHQEKAAASVLGLDGWWGGLWDGTVVACGVVGSEHQ